MLISTVIDTWNILITQMDHLRGFFLNSLSEISIGVHNWPFYSFSMNALWKMNKSKVYLNLAPIGQYLVRQIGICQPLHTAQCSINKETYYPKHDCTKHAVKHNSISFSLNYTSHNSINLLWEYGTENSNQENIPIVFHTITLLCQILICLTCITTTS